MYSCEKNVQILISLLKQHGIKRVIASPGAINITFVGSIQSDPWFEIYSSVDERSAGYMACGMAAETGEPVVLTCTGATASRNYVPALTEAYYRKLPIIAITSGQPASRIGHNIPQVIDRTAQMNDIVKTSVQIPAVFTKEDEWAINVAINKAILDMSRHGGGPVHINLTSSYSRNFSVPSLPLTRMIRQITCSSDNWPAIEFDKIGILVGNHERWNDCLTKAVDDFCEKYGAIVLHDHTSKYFGNYGILPNLILSQEKKSEISQFDLLIDIGNTSGAYINVSAKNVWRVNPDGEIRDRFHNLKLVFEMEETTFFESYNKLNISPKETNLITAIKEEDNSIRDRIPALPFSNIWAAQQLSQRLPDDSVLHLGILNSLRSWNLFPIKNHVECYSNTGGFGIDGVTSALIGASLVDHSKLYFGVVGDLAFFYDINSVGNRYVGKNLRILLINNGCGTEFKNYNHLAAVFEDDADQYIAAAGHYGNKSKTLVKHYSEDLGFLYLCANNKEEFSKNIPAFIDPLMDKPIIFEMFTDSKNESDALHIISSLLPKDEIESPKETLPTKLKKATRSVFGDNRVEGLKKLIKG